MSLAVIGGLVGGVLGLVNFAFLQNLAKQMSLKSGAEEKNKTADVLRWVAWADLIIFPLVGYFVGPMFGP
ncbi:MAG: hypothetical protein K0U34_08120 [Alphaproteobacteria bacterium]|nr:hypothetical protein [Alphaproteobacteria bacterium]